MSVLKTMCFVLTCVHHLCESKGSSSSSGGACDYDHFGHPVQKIYAKRVREVKRFNETYLPMAFVTEIDGRQFYYQKTKKIALAKSPKYHAYQIVPYFEEAVCNTSYYFNTTSENNTITYDVKLFWICDESELCCARNCCLDENYKKLHDDLMSKMERCDKSQDNRKPLFYIVIGVLAFGVGVIVFCKSFEIFAQCFCPQLLAEVEPKQPIQNDANSVHDVAGRNEEIQMQKIAEAAQNAAELPPPPGYEDAVRPNGLV